MIDFEVHAAGAANDETRRELLELRRERNAASARAWRAEAALDRIRQLAAPDEADGAPFAFALRARVEKHTGSYRLCGEIVARFRADDGQPRYVVNHKPTAPGLLHIYAEAQLKPERT